jgi:hypothetical protein
LVLHKEYLLICELHHQTECVMLFQGHCWIELNLFTFYKYKTG